jgi:outer membrane receptor protein involved in Fe transport
VFFLGGMLQGQNVQKCRVVSKESGNEMPYATVIFDDSTHTVSDNNGYFTFPFSQSDERIHISISFVGFHDLDTTLKFIDGIHTLRMKTKAIQSEEFLVVGKKILSSDKSRSQRVIKLDSKALETLPAKDMQTLLNAIPGVTVDNALGLYDTKTTVMLHGIGGGEQGRTLVLKDGVPLNKADGGTVSWNMLNKDLFSEAEVIKGASSSLYGANAMGGVILLRSNAPQKSFSGNAMLEYGTYNTIGTSLNARGVIENENSDERKIWWKSAMKYRYSDGYINIPTEYLEDGEDTLLVPAGLNQSSIALTGGMENENSSFILSVNVMNDKHGTGWKIFEEDGGYSRHQHLNTNISYLKRLKNISLHSVAWINHDQYHKQNEYVADGDYKLYEVDAPRLDAGVRFDFENLHATRNSLKWGVDFRYGNVDAADTYFTSTDIIRNYGESYIGGIYVWDDLQLLENRLNITAGLRGSAAGFFNGGYTIEMPSYHIQYLMHYADAEIENFHWTALTPSLALNMKSASGHSRLYLSWGQGFRPPVLDDMCRATNENYLFRIPNPRLKPEVIDNFEVGGDLSIFDNTNFTFSVYRSYGHDFMYSVCTGDSVDQGFRIIPIAKIQNIGEVEITGAELTLEQQIGRRFVMMAYGACSQGIIASYDAENIISTYDLNGKYLTGIPDWQAGTTIMWYGEVINAGATWKYQGKRWINDANTWDYLYLNSPYYPAYHTIDLRVGWDINKSWTLALDVQNLMDEVYITRKGLRSPGRFILGSVKFTL